MARKSSQRVLQSQGLDSLTYFLKEMSAVFYGDTGSDEESARPTTGTLADPTLDPLTWAKRYRTIEDRPFSLGLIDIAGRRMSFAPLEQIYLDKHPFIVIQKPAQRGLSELAVSLVCHTLDIGDRYWRTGKRGLNVGYLFPTQEALDQFSKERFAGLLTENDYLADLFSGNSSRRGYDNIRFKQARNSYLYLRGAYAASGKTEKPRPGLKSWAADYLFLDEYDDMDKTAIAQAEKRLAGSVLRRRMYFSTPSYPGKGINGLYLTSDQMVWLTPCHRCGDYYQLDFFRDVFCNGDPYDGWQHHSADILLAGAYSVHCPNCQDAIPDLVRFTEGQWEAQEPDIVAVRGYLIPALCFAQCDLSQIAANVTSVEPTKVIECFKQDLGLPFSLSGSRITETMLEALGHMLERGILPAGPWSNTTMGIDVGRRLHFRITSTGPGGLRYVRAMGTLRSTKITEGQETRVKSMWEYASDLLRQFKVRRCVVDALPESDACERWADKHPGIVYRAFYPGRKKVGPDMFVITSTKKEKKEAEKAKRKPKENIMHIDRVRAMDALFGRVKNAEEVWPASAYTDKEVRQNMTAPTRVEVEDKEGNTHAEWQHSSPDHFYHASTYDLMAFLSLPKSLAGLWSPGESTKGWQP